MSRFTQGTKRYFLASLHADGLSQTDVFQKLRPLVLAQTKPWIFSANVPGQGRRPKSISEQLVDLKHEISRVWALIEREGNEVPSGEFSEPEEKPEEKPATGCDDCRRNVELFYHEESGLSLCDNCISKREKPQKKLSHKETERRFFLSEWKRVREWISQQVATHGTTPVDSLDTMRPIQGARAAIDQGISARAMLFAMVLHWPEATRENAGIPAVDFTTESEDLGDGFHKLTGYVLKLANARIPTMLIGPAGTGKSHIARQVASLIKTEAHPDGLPYGETPMTPGATRGDLLGRMTASPDKEDRFVLSQFVEIYSGGGVFNFEEIDAADPGMLIVINNALASGYLFNSVNGEKYERHPDFIPMATANTFGMGADAKYTGREKLDLATIDRFRMGRVLVSLDESLAESLMNDEG